MALLELAYWQSKELPFSAKQVVSAPEFPATSSCYPTSPTPNPSTCTLMSPTSQDSGFDSPWNIASPSHSITPESSVDACTTNPTFQPPRHLLAAAGSGFSLGIITCDKGTLHQLSVPIPEQILDSPSIDITAFTRTDITTIAVVGDSQIWAGTSLGTLHCMELMPQQRLKNHSFISINESILCICSRPLEYIFPSISQPNSSIQSSMTTEVLIGVPFGYMIVLAGEANGKGHLKKSVDKLSSRRIIRFTNSPVDCEVNCIAHVYSETEGECYWCGCGGNVFIVRSSDWKKIQQIDARIDKHLNPSQVQVAHLQVTDAGVWSYLSKSSSITLWDRTNFSVKLHLNYCNSRRSLSLQPETSCLHYSYPLVFVGTEQGDLMVFQIKEKYSSLEGDSNPKPSTSKHEYKFISSTHVGPHPIACIQATTTHSNRSLNVLSSTPSPNPSSVVNIFVLERPTDLVCDKSRAHIYELCLTPPHSVRSSPLSDITILSASSLRNNSLTPRRLSVISSTIDFLPLQNND